MPMSLIVDFQQLLDDGLVATENVECSTIIKKKDSAIKAKSAGYEVFLAPFIMKYITIAFVANARTNRSSAGKF